MDTPSYIKMDLEETVCVDVGWIHQAKDMVQWLAFMNTEYGTVLCFPQEAGNFLTS
jgi:hypothetical protein